MTVESGFAPSFGTLSSRCSTDPLSGHKQAWLNEVIVGLTTVICGLWFGLVLGRVSCAAGLAGGLDLQLLSGSVLKPVLISGPYQSNCKLADCVILGTCGSLVNQMCGSSSSLLCVRPGILRLRQAVSMCGQREALRLGSWSPRFFLEAFESRCWRSDASQVSCKSPVDCTLLSTETM